MVRVVEYPNKWVYLALGMKGIKLVCGRLITPLTMALQRIETTTSAHFY